MGPWGFVCFHAVLYYGKRPGGAKSPASITSNHLAERNGHPCPKPIEWLTWALELGSDDGEMVLEPFCGSGTTLIACEQLGRRCRAVEIDPGYAAVTLQRWADATGGTPELIG